jgi:peptide/nickel transport system substrate-binding protein
MATLVQDDLKQLGFKVRVVSMEFRAVSERITQSHDYDTALMGLGGGDADPNAAMGVWTSNGQAHAWNMGEKVPSTPWQAEIDRLMQQQLVTMNYRQRKKLYDRVQQIAAEQLPIICLASPHVLVGGREGLGNFHPVILDQYTLWNAEELFWSTPGGK